MVIKIIIETIRSQAPDLLETYHTYSMVVRQKEKVQRLNGYGVVIGYKGFLQSLISIPALRYSLGPRESVISIYAYM
jgi:hypothetical protein